MKKHYVTFYSPGTFVAEETTKEIDSWGVEGAKEMARDIVERHGATPYGFQFVTRERKRKDFDSKEIKRSNMYYLGGEVFTLEELKAKNDPGDKILISNMEGNGWNEVLVNTNSWKWTQPLKKGDIVLDFN